MGRRSTVARGFAYLVLLLWLAIAGALLGGLGTHWSFEARREREAEFVFRGEQYRRAIESYEAPINLNGCSNVQELPEELDQLIEDHRCGLLRHHLRRLYPDPVARSPSWALVIQRGRIRGVRGSSTDPPVRRIEGVTSYADWMFLADGVPASPVAPSASAIFMGSQP